MCRIWQVIFPTCLERYYPEQRINRPALLPTERPLKLGFRQCSFHHVRLVLTVRLNVTILFPCRLFPRCYVHVPLSQFQPFPAPLTWVHTHLLSGIFRFTQLMRLHGAPCTCRAAQGFGERLPDRAPCRHRLRWCSRYMRFGTFHAGK